MTSKTKAGKLTNLQKDKSRKRIKNVCIRIKVGKLLQNDRI